MFFPRLHIVKCEFRRKRNRDTSIELEPLGTTTTRLTTATTVTNDEESELSENMPSGFYMPTRSSGLYSYCYDHMTNRLLAFFSLHLRPRQDFCSLSRPSSAPPTQVPHPPGHMPPVSPPIPPILHQVDPRNLGCSSSCDDIEQKSQTLSHVSTSPEPIQRIESNFYDEILDNELTNEYSDVAEVWME